MPMLISDGHVEDEGACLNQETEGVTTGKIQIAARHIHPIEWALLSSS